MVTLGRITSAQSVRRPPQVTVFNAGHQLWITIGNIRKGILSLSTGGTSTPMQRAVRIDIANWPPMPYIRQTGTTATSQISELDDGCRGLGAISHWSWWWMDLLRCPVEIVLLRPSRAPWTWKPPVKGPKQPRMTSLSQETSARGSAVLECQHLYCDDVLHFDIPLDWYGPSLYVMMVFHTVTLSDSDRKVQSVPDYYPSSKPYQVVLWTTGACPIAISIETVDIGAASSRPSQSTCQPSCINVQHATTGSFLREDSGIENVLP